MRMDLPCEMPIVDSDLYAVQHAHGVAAADSKEMDDGIFIKYGS